MTRRRSFSNARLEDGEGPCLEFLKSFSNAMNMRYLLVRSAAATAIFDVTLIDRFAPHQTINHHPSSSSAAAGDRLVDEKATYLAMCKKPKILCKKHKNNCVIWVFGMVKNK